MKKEKIMVVNYPLKLKEVEYALEAYYKKYGVDGRDPEFYHKNISISKEAYKLLNDSL